MPGAMAQNNALVAAQMGLQAQPSITDADLLNQRKSYEMYGRSQGYESNLLITDPNILSLVPLLIAPERIWV